MYFNQIMIDLLNLRKMPDLFKDHFHHLKIKKVIAKKNVDEQKNYIL